MTVRGELTVRNPTTGAVTTINSTATTVLNPVQNNQLRPKRESLGASLNFPVPAAFITAEARVFTLTRVVDATTGATLNCSNCATSPRSVAFVASSPMRVRMIGLQYTTGTPGTPPTTFAPRAVDFTLLQSWLRRGYPINQLIASQSTVTSSNTWPFTSNQANAQLSALRATEVAGGIDGRSHYVGLVFNGGGYMRGSASGIPASPDPTVVCSFPTGAANGGTGPVPVNVTGDTDASYGDWYGGHELGHTFGRFHPGFCNGNSSDDPSFPYPNGQISDNQGTFVGFDVGDAANGIATTVLPGASRFDIMTYCNQPQWLSAYAYQGVRARLNAENPSGTGGPPPLRRRGGSSRPRGSRSTRRTRSSRWPSRAWPVRRAS